MANPRGQRSAAGKREEGHGRTHRLGQAADTCHLSSAACAEASGQGPGLVAAANDKNPKRPGPPRRRDTFAALPGATERQRDRREAALAVPARRLAAAGGLGHGRLPGPRAVGLRRQKSLRPASPARSHREPAAPPKSHRLSGVHRQHRGL
ncbi:protein of unknown function [Candidatus Methylocalor cossyra]|uniref:Uncharacterized protein n=1 Tax=Candidatus Methylocalor cossyra TaxID=3108543 RepID=A0ABP1C936_9GAMM